MVGNFCKHVTIYCVIILISFFRPATILSNEEPADSAASFELVFSHRVHVDSAGIACTACHPAAKESARGADDLVQPKANYLGCHEENPCSRCHTDQRKPESFARVTAYSPLFNHQAHITMGLECSACHQKLSDSPAEAARVLPEMAACMACHNGETADRDCYTCHKFDEDLKPQDHKQKQWMVVHVGAVMKDRGKSCEICHTNKDCAACHAGDYLIPAK